MIEKELLESVGTDAIGELVDLLREVESEGLDPASYLDGMVRNLKSIRAFHDGRDPNDEEAMRSQAAFIQEHPWVLHYARSMRLSDLENYKVPSPAVMDWIIRLFRVFEVHKLSPETREMVLDLGVRVGRAFTRDQIEALIKAWDAGLFPPLARLAETLTRETDEEPERGLQAID